MFIRNAALLTLAAFALAGCGRDDVKVYRVAKDDSTPPPNQMPVPGQGSMAQPAPPQLQWTLPSGWQEKTPGQMRAASFTVTGADGQNADVGVIPLPATGQEIQLVNMWREQMQLPAATNADEAAETVAIGDAPGRLFDIASSEPLIDGKFRARILVAMLTTGGQSWFFKMTGGEAFVASEKPSFIEFLKSIRFIEAAPLSVASAATASDENGKPAWTVPSGWQEMPPSEFLAAKFGIAGADGTKAQVNVSSLAGTGGGLLANVNRWRGQIGLGAVGEDGLAQLTQPLGKAMLVDMAGVNGETGAQVRLVGAVVPLAGQTWFYKLMGDEKIVGQQKEAFIKFVQSAQYPDARNAP